MDETWLPLSEIGTMTHWPEQPNPVHPIVEAVRRYLQSGDYNPVHELGTQPADYLRELARNPDILAKNIDQAANFNFGGAMRSKITPEQLIRMKELAQSGSPLSAIGNELGLSKGVINNQLRNAGMQTNNPRGGQTEKPWSPERDQAIIDGIKSGKKWVEIADDIGASNAQTARARAQRLEQAGKLTSQDIRRYTTERSNQPGLPTLKFMQGPADEIDRAELNQFIQIFGGR